MPTDAARLVEKTVQVDGHTIYYSEAGSGDAVIFIHGLGNSSYNWRKNVPVIGKTHRAVTLDLPGHGKSDLIWFPMELEPAAKFITHFADALGIGKFHVVGNSLGGSIALQTAISYPERVRSITLVGSVSLGKECAKFLKLASLPFLGEYGHRANPKVVRNLLRSLVYNPSVIEEAAVEEMVTFRRKPGGVKGIVGIIRSGVTIFGQRKRVQRGDSIQSLKVPLLVAWGRQDPVVPFTHGERAAKLAQRGRIKIFDECGHWPHLEHPDTFNALYLDFIGQAKP